MRGTPRGLLVGAAFAVLVGGWFGWNAPEPAPTLTILSVGQGSCAVLRADGRTILFDAGPKSEYVDGGRAFVLPKLRAMGVRTSSRRHGSQPPLSARSAQLGNPPGFHNQTSSSAAPAITPPDAVYETRAAATSEPYPYTGDSEAFLGLDEIGWENWDYWDDLLRTQPS